MRFEYDEYWRITVVTVTLAILFTLIGFFLGSLRTENSTQNHEPINAAQSHDSSANYQSDGLSKFTPPIPFQSDPASTKETNGTASEKDQRDLEAQEWMSFSTFWMFVVTSVGVVLLFFTLLATRNINVVTRDIGRKQVRAYVTVRGGEFCIDKELLVIRPVLKNFGQSPAQDPRIDSLIVGLEIDKTLNLSKYNIPGFLQNEEPVRFLNIAASDEESGCSEIDVSFLPALYFLNLVRFGRVSLNVTGSIEWFDVFGELQKETFILFLEHNRKLSKDGSLCGTLSRKE